MAMASISRSFRMTVDGRNPWAIPDKEDGQISSARKHPPIWSGMSAMTSASTRP